MKINNLVIGTILALGASFLAAPAYAEEVHEGGSGEWTEPETVEETPHEGGTGVITTPEHTDYVPPVEAYEGVGGWAVVNPLTGVVHGVVVCQASYCGPDGESGGVTGTSYMGCPVGCVYRFQTRAQASGNVAGIASGGGNSVTWDGDGSGTFSVRSETNINGSISRLSSTLVPSRTMADGESIYTGLINSRSSSIMSNGISINQFTRDYLDTDVETDILFPAWGQGGKLFSYMSQLDATNNISSDVDDELFAEGYTVDTTQTDELTNEEVTETNIDEDNPFVQTVRQWTQSVLDFFRGWIS